MQRRLPPCYADLAEGLDGDSLLHEREDLEQALRQASRCAPVRVLQDFPARPRAGPGDPVYNAAFRSMDTTAPLSPLMLGIICLLHKPRQPDDEINSHRPITLLNCDVKLVMLVMANRLQLPLEFLFT